MDNEEKTVKDVFDTFTEEQKTVVYALIGQALEDTKSEKEDEKDVFDTFTEEQKTVVYALIGQALEDAKSEKEDKSKHSDEIEGGNDTMKHNIFDNDKQTQEHIW